MQMITPLLMCYINQLLIKENANIIRFLPIKPLVTAVERGLIVNLMPPLIIINILIARLGVIVGDRGEVLGRVKPMIDQNDT